jgi:hypothetical protein
MLAGVLYFLGLRGLFLDGYSVLLGLGLAVTLWALVCWLLVLACSHFLQALRLLACWCGWYKALVGIVTALIGLIPMAFKAVAEGIIQFALVITGAVLPLQLQW